jgi:O-antigen ligase
MFLPARNQLGEWSLLLLLIATALWKGGKSLESTWLLAGLAFILTIGYWLNHSKRRQEISKQLENRQGTAASRKELPLYLWILSLLFIAWNILSYLFSQTQNYGLDDVFRACACTFIFLWVARVQIDSDGNGMRRHFPVFLSFSAFAASVIGTFIYILQPVNRFVGTFFDLRFHTDYWPNAWAEFLLLAWPMVLLLAWRSSRKKSGWMFYAMLGFITAALLLSYSRGAFLAALGQLVIASLMLLSVLARDIRYRRNWKLIVKNILMRVAVVLAIAAVCFAAVNAARSQFHDVESVTKKVTFTAAEGRSSIDERSQFWKQSFEKAVEKPVAGWGPYSFRFIQPALMKNVLATSDHPHNVLLKLAMEQGFPAAILFAQLFGSVLITAIFSFFTTRKSANMDADAFTILSIASLCGLLLHNMIDFNLQFVAIEIAAVICLALLVPPAMPIVTAQEDSFRRWRIRRSLSHVDVFLALMLLILVCWEGVFLVTSSLGRHALAAGDVQRAQRWFERSHMELFSRDLFLSEAQIHLQQKEYDEALQSTARYIQLNEHDPRAWKIRGEIQLRAGNPVLAVEALERAYDQGAYTDAGILSLLLEAVRGAEMEERYKSRKMEFDTLFAAYADAIENNVHFIALSNNVEELQQIARLLAAMYPLDAERYKIIARSASSHARTEREAYDARSPGMLW